MKLLYVWINRSQSGFIQKQGFNFSVEYKFSVVYSEPDDCYVLSCKHDESSKDIWKTGNISGLTAVVGENGSGKTTLLNDLFSPEVYPKKNTDSRPAYKEYYKERDQLQEKISVYDIDGKVQIVHNLSTEKFQNRTTFDAYDVNTMLQDDREEWMANIERQTIIYLTNSSHTSVFGGYTMHGPLQGINLSPKSLRVSASAFFNKVTLKSKGLQKLDYFYQVQEIIRRYKRQDKDFDIQTLFQVILDLHYYLFLNQEGLASNFREETAIKELHVKTCNFPSIFMENTEIDVAFPNEKEDSKESTRSRIERIYQEVVRWATVGEINRRLDQVSELIVLLIFEMKYSFGEDIFQTKDVEEDKSSWNYPEYINVAEKILENCSGIQEKDEEQLEYYQRGLEEIRMLYEILKDCHHCTSTLPPEDLAHPNDFVLSYAENKEKYIEFCQYIDSIAQFKCSFVLKYLRIETTGISSGERAIQNMFSWLLLPPAFNKYIEETPIPIKDDVLLLIDEIDLYMHPEWQRQCLKVLADNLKLQYPDKHIQIVVATHSPLVLSDVPKQNTIYLRGASVRSSLEHLQVADYGEISETFGANIHQILSRSFFLKNTMGAYAYDIVHDMAENLAKLKNLPTEADDYKTLTETCKYYLPTINLVGESMIRNILLSMYYDCFGRDQKIVVQELEYSIAKVSNSAKHLERDQVQLLKEKLEKAAEALSEYL